MWNNYSSSYASVSSPGPLRSSSTVFPSRTDSSYGIHRESPTRSSLLLPINGRSGEPWTVKHLGYLRALLKQRKQSEPDLGYYTRGTARDAASAYGLGSTTPSTATSRGGFGLESSGTNWVQNTPAGQMQSLSQQEYMNRLLAAHTRVDDLLRSRGLNSDDENKYIRAWEQIPIIREERFRRLRSPSNSSDSGLSTDNDSDRSNAEPAVVETTVQLNEELEQYEDDVCCFEVFPLNSKIIERVSKTLQSTATSTQDRSVAAVFKQAAQVQKCSIVSPIIMATSNKAQFREPKILPKVVAKTTGLPPSPAEAIVTRNLGLIKKTCQVVCGKIWKDKKTHSTSARFDASVTNDIEKSFVFKRRRTVDPGAAEQKRQVLSSLKRKSTPPIPSTAEISIQHCSFYQIKQAAYAALPEKNVRINLRLTERAPKNCAATVVLPAPPRIAYARLDILLESPKRMRRTLSTQLIAPKKKLVGKLERGFTVDISDVPRELRKVNRLKIPEYFLQQSAEVYEDIGNVRNSLKQVKQSNMIIGGFVYELKPQPQSSLRRAGAIRRKPPPQKTIQEIVGAEPFADFLPTEPPDPPDPPPDVTKCHPIETGHLNLPGSLDCPATSSGASPTRTESTPIAELSETDRRLVEQFRRSLNIPCPKAIIRALSPLTLRCFHQDIVENRKSQSNVRWIRRRSPIRKAPQKVRSPSPPCLKRVYRSSKKVTKYTFGEWTVSLKQVDKHAPLRPKPKRRRLPKWIPRWRRKPRSEEEVEEVEEEEVVEEEVEEDEHKSDAVPSSEHEPRHDRVISKSYNDEDTEGLTEGEKAMAVAKRRHEEDQQAKLLNYEEKRRIEREKEEEELRRLKEKQEKRRLEREQEEREMIERRQQDDERRRKEDEDRKQKIEDEKRKKEESTRKKNQISGGAFSSIAGSGTGGRNFTVPKKSDTMGDKFGNIVQAKQEMGMTKDQQEQAKQAFLAQIAKGLAEASGLPAADLKNKIKELHHRICKLEADKYDLEKRHERQEYDLKELNERQRQVARNNAMKKGLDPAEAGNSRHPRNAHPCFPGVPPPAVILEKVILKYDTEEKDEGAELDKPDQLVELAKGSARPPADWGKKVVHEDIEAYLRNPERCPKYIEKVESANLETRGSPQRIVKPLIVPQIFAN